MRITDNLIEDISNAPDWFFDAIKIEPKECEIKNSKGNLSYSKWDCDSESKSLLISVSYTHLTLPTNREV